MITPISTENSKGFIDRDHGLLAHKFRTKLNVSSFQLWSPVSSRVTFMLPHPMQGHYQRTSVDGEKFSFHLSSLSHQKDLTRQTCFTQLGPTMIPRIKRTLVSLSSCLIFALFRYLYLITNVIQQDKCWIKGQTECSLNTLISYIYIFL